MSNLKDKGKIGEEIAVKFLEKNEVNIIKRNYFTKYGEIDLIGFKNQTIIFIEVKLRNSDNFGHPSESITESKFSRMYDVASCYLSENNIEYQECRFDIIFIIQNKDNTYKVEWLKGQYFN